jgi:[ribosomal protein S18]-alanine N-acetyltransferase
VPVALEVRPASATDRGPVVALVAEAQREPSRHVAYLSLGTEPIAEELGALEPDGWDGVLVARRGDQLVGALATELDRDPPRVWWHGPFVAPGERFGEVAAALLTAARARLPGHVTEEELAGDDAHRDLATFAREHGFEAAVASAVLHRSCAPSSPPLDLDGPAARVLVRPFVEADRDEVARLHDLAFPAAHVPGQRVDEGEDRFVLVAGAPGAVVGYAAAERHADGSGYLDLLGVRPEVRGGGVGSALVVAVVRELADRGCEVVNLTVRETNLGARRLYERLGFTEERLVRPYRRGFTMP